MSEPGVVRTPATAGPVRFPPGEVIFRDRPFQRSLFADVDALIRDGHCPEGRFEVSAGDVRLTALIHDSAPFLAGSLDGATYQRMSLYDFVLEAPLMHGALATLTRTDSPLMMMAAVHFCQRPHMQGSVHYVGPAHLLRAISEERRDAAIAFERSGTRTLLFLHRGRPARLYFGDPADDPGDGDLDERVLEFAFAPGAAETGLEVFALEKIQADRDAGTPLDTLAQNARPAPPLLVKVGLPGGRALIQRLFTPPEMVLGRERSCELHLDNLAVSRRHCRIYWGRGRFFVEDLGSANGTFVNDHQENRCEIDIDDEIRVGKFQICLSDRLDSDVDSETLLLGSRAVGAPAFLDNGEVSVPLERDVIVGKGNGVDSRAKGLFVRQVHARIAPRGIGIYRLTCFGRATVKLNGTRVHTSRVQIGDVIEIGRTELRVVSEPDLHGEGDG
jgi:pSer/pThr/pTyr-binding forkhead associated (FHA) protein